MSSFLRRSLPLIALATLLFTCLLCTTAFGAGERATFDTGSNVRSAWTALAGGNRNNVTAIKQYTGSSVPEGVTTRTVSSSSSELPIYSWFDDGTIYYWSEDTHPYTNADASYMFNAFQKATVIDVAPFDTSKTTDMEAMFANLSSVKVLDVSGFDTSNARCMYCMFVSCSSLEQLDVSRFNTTRATAASDQSYGSLCGMFLGCSTLKELDLSSFDMTGTSWPYHTQNMFTGCTSLEKLTLGPKCWFNGYTNLSGSWTHEDDGLTLGGGSLTSQYTAANALAYSGTWIRNMPEGHYYRTDGSLGDSNLWEVHTPDNRFKGYCLNLNKFGVGEELDRVLAEDDADIAALLCTSDQGSTHGCAPLGSTMREALITLIYYGWPNDAAGIQERYGLSDQEYMEITQNAVWDFTDRYDEPAGPTLYTGNALEAYNELVAQRFANIDGDYILFLYKSWDPSKQNLLSIQGVDDQEYGGVAVRKQNASGSENLAGAEFTVYDEDGNEVGTMTTSAAGVGYICQTDHSTGLPLGDYTVRETKPPAGYELSDVEYHFTISEANEIVTEGWRKDGMGNEIVEEMIYYDKHDDTYTGGGIGIVKKSDTGKMLVGAEFSILDEGGAEVAKLVTNNSGVAATGNQDLPLGTYTVRETRAPEGHTMTAPEQTVEITENMQMLTLTFTDNEKRGSIELETRKVLDIEGQELAEGQFTFQLLDAHYNVIQTATNDADGTVAFKPITYTPDDLGYENYHIVEVIGDDDGIRYDRHQEDVTVTIYDTGADELECTAIYDSDGAVFTNKQSAEKTVVSILKTKLNTDDVVEGAALEIRDGSKRLIDSWTSSGEAHVVELDPGTYTLKEIAAPSGYFEFSDIKFTVAEDGSISCSSGSASIDGSTMRVRDKSVASTELEIRKVDGDSGETLEGAEFTLEGTEGSGYSATVTTDGDGAATFAGLESGTYTLTETNPPSGYRADAGPWTVEVSYGRAISKSDNINNSGVASGTYPAGKTTTDKVTLPGSPESIHVELRYQTEDGWDYLELLDGSGNVIKQDKDGDSIGDNGRIWGGMESGEIDTLAFDLPGDTVTFRFYSDENTAAYGYYALVTAGPNITVTDAYGAAVSPEDGVYTFENTEKATTSVRFAGTKTLSGRDLADAEFTFELRDAEGEAIGTASNDADGTFAFDEISYEEPGTYTYQVAEVAGDEAGVTYDDTVYDITVTVAENEGELVATLSGDTTTGDDLDFANSYKYAGESTSVRFEGTKTLEGRDLEAEEFAFDLRDGDGKLIETVRNDAGGAFAFSEIVYDEPGVFEYEVDEVVDLEEEESGIAYDTTVYEITVTVEDEDGKLVATVEGADPEALDFTNTYTEHSVSLAFGGTKSFEGYPSGVEPPQFTYTLSENGEVIDEATTPGAGVYRFGSIAYTEAGEHTYTIAETTGEAGGVTYDEKTYTVVVTVEENEDGQLVATLGGDSETGLDLDFANSYAAGPTSIRLQGTKTLAGRDLAEGEFEFTLEDGSGEVIETVANGADGAIVFSEITFDEPGTYTFKVAELASDEEGVIYDDTVYVLRVTVADKGSGQLETMVKGADPTALNFANATTSTETDDGSWTDQEPDSGLPDMDANSAPTDGKPKPAASASTATARSTLPKAGDSAGALTGLVVLAAAAGICLAAGGIRRKRHG